MSSLAEEKLPTCSPRFPQLRNILPGIYDLDQGLTKKLAIFHLIFDVAVWIFGTTQTYQISDRSAFINSISLRTRNRGKLNLTIPRKQTPQPRLSPCPKKRSWLSLARPVPLVLGLEQSPDKLAAVVTLFARHVRTAGYHLKIRHAKLIFTFLFCHFDKPYTPLPPSRWALAKRERWWVISWSDLHCFPFVWFWSSSFVCIFILLLPQLQKWYFEV